MPTDTTAASDLTQVAVQSSHGSREREWITEPQPLPLSTVRIVATVSVKLTHPIAGRPIVPDELTRQRSCAQRSRREAFVMHDTWLCLGADVCHLSLCNVAYLGSDLRTVGKKDKEPYLFTKQARAQDVLPQPP